MSQMTDWWVFGRESDDRYEAWWPLWNDDGPVKALSAQGAIEKTRNRILETREENWTDLAAVPAAHWHGPPLQEPSPPTAREALAELVRLKDGPRDEAYAAAKEAAWEAARKALAAGDVQLTGVSIRRNFLS